MHWTYAEAPDVAQLHQGDVLARTPEIDALLAEVHNYYLRPDNIYFMVLTQSCDLVRRPVAKADYIAICPVRPISSIINRAIRNLVPSTTGGIPVGSQKDRARFESFLARLFNNNEPGLFYLYRDEAFAEDCCAFTRLSISVRTKEHYDKCLDAKVVELSDSFRAKLGWAVGNIYSRVGTQDWDDQDLKTRIEEAQSSSIVWVADDKAQKNLMQKLEALHAAEDQVTEQMIQDIINSRASTREQVVELVQNLMVSAGVDEAQRLKVEKRLRSDPKLGQLIKA